MYIIHSVPLKHSINNPHKADDRRFLYGKAVQEGRRAELLDKAVGRFSQKSCEIFMNLLERLFKRDVI